MALTLGEDWSEAIAIQYGRDIRSGLACMQLFMLLVVWFWRNALYANTPADIRGGSVHKKNYVEGYPGHNRNDRARVTRNTLDTRCLQEGIA